MCRVISISCALVLCMAFAIGASAAEHRERARPGSFVQYSANSVGELVEQVNNNPAVAKRYASHFGMPKEQLATYFSQNLKVVTLTAPAKVTTYFVSKYGTILSKQRTLPAGRRVFTNEDNKILIETGCGNPVTKRLPAPKPKVETEVKPAVETIGTPPIAESVPAPIAEVVQPEVVAQLPILEPLIEPISAFRSGPSIMGFMGALAPVLAGVHYVQASRDTYIPEPASAIPVALGSVGVASAFIRQRRNARKKGSSGPSQVE